MRLTEDVYLVGGSTLNGFGLSGGMDSHIYVLDGGSSLALIDCGMAADNSIARITRNMESDGLRPERLEKVFISHYHVDHVGGLRAWLEQTHLRSAAIGADAAEAVEQANVDATGFRLACESEVYPPEYELHPASIDDPLRDGDVREVGDLTVQFISTPGHCNGHGCYLVIGRGRRYLFTGDCVFHGGEIALLNTADSDVAAYRSSVLRLESLQFDSLLPGHGALALEGGMHHIKIAADAFRTLLLPKGFV